MEIPVCCTTANCNNDILIPMLFFLKKMKGILLSPPSVRLSVMLSPPNTLDEMQPNLAVSYSHELDVQQHIFWPRPLGS